MEKSISLLAGIKEVAGKAANVLYAKGSNLDYDGFRRKATMFGKTLHRDDRTSKNYWRALKIANQSDIIVAALGESAEMSGKVAAELSYPFRKLKRIYKNCLKPVVLVLFTGRPLVLVQENETVPAILNTWFAGSEAGSAIADVLFET
jgi:beta-glucosidase